MKFLTSLAALILAVGLAMSQLSGPHATTQDARKPPETITLAKEGKLGAVVFSHTKHITGKWSADGKSQIACVDCHHTAQPLAEALKRPPHKTVYPADRTTTLTTELLEKDANAPAVNICTDCHARADSRPKLIAEIPMLKFEGSEEPTLLTNQQAFHRKCGGCHDEAVKARPGLVPAPPTSKKCLVCHKRTAD